MKKTKRVKPPGWFELFEKLSYAPEDRRDYMLDVRTRYRRAVGFGDLRKARNIVARETTRLVRNVWLPRFITLFVLWTKFRGS